MSTPDFKAIAAAALPHVHELLMRWLPDGELSGFEFTARNPTRVDQSAGSFRVNVKSTAWSDFSTGDKGGDLISLAAFLFDLSQSEAAGYLTHALRVEGPAIEAEGRLRSAFAPVDGEPVVLIDDAPEGVFTPADCGPSDSFLRGSRFGRVPDGIWHYRNAASQIVLAVCRWNDGQKKSFLNASPWNDGTGNTVYRWKGMMGQRPLYDLPKLLDNPGAKVLVCEGEKARDAAERMLPKGWLATCWAGGAQSVLKTDWSALLGREVWIWPDADDAGKKAAQAIVDLLPEAYTFGDRAIAACRQIRGPLPQGFDAADLEDEGVSKLDSLAFSSSSVSGLDIVDICDLMDQNPDMKLPIVHGLLRQAEVCNIIAAPKIGKSWLIMNLAVSISTGREWLGFQCEQGRVLIIDNELHEPTLAARMRQVLAAMGLTHADIRGKIAAVCLRGKHTGLDSIAKELGKLQAGTYSIAIVDALYRAMPAKTEENSNSDMRDIYNLLDQTAARMQTAFICVHHSSKGAQAGKGITDVGAGAGATSRAADAHVVLRPHQESGKVVMEAVCRSWPTPPARVLEWSDEGRWLVDPHADPTRLAGSKEMDSPPVSLLGLLTDEPRPIALLVSLAKKRHIKKSALEAALAEEESESRAFTWKNAQGKVVWSRKPKPEAAPKADKAEAILTYRNNNPSATVAEVAKAVGASETYVRQKLPVA